MADKRNRGRRITDRITEAYYGLMKIVAENNHERMFEYYVEDDWAGRVESPVNLSADISFDIAQ